MENLRRFETDGKGKLKYSQIQSLDRGLQLLEYIGHSGKPLSLADLEGVIEVDRSTIHRLLSTMIERGYIQQDQESKRYSIGLKVLQLSRFAIDNIPLRKVAKSFLEELRKESGESANLAVLAGNQAICIDHEPSTSALSVTNDIGANFVLHATSTGKVLLSNLTEDQRDQLLFGKQADARLEAFTPRTITNIDTLHLHLEQVRQQGYALDDEERYLGVRCVAAPVWDYRGKVAASIGISGPTIRVSYDRLPDLTSLVKRIAAGLSAALGSPSR
jgi:DNA-binding IclR family transcriptional regulator